jgi:peptidoglycan/xylan/chitin deacetylase (PgdA/CDA1 family)
MSTTETGRALHRSDEINRLDRCADAADARGMAHLQLHRSITQFDDIVDRRYRRDQRQSPITRRTFLATLAAGSVAAAGCAMCDGLALPNATAASGPDLAAVAAHYRGQTPTQWGTSLPGVATTFAASGRQIVLTFDACDRRCDESLLATLERQSVPALLFLSSKWIDANPGRAEQLAANPLFDIGNHGTRHVPLSVTGRSAYGIGGTRSADEVVTEVWTNHTRLAALTGTPPAWFRPGTAYYDNVAVAIVEELGVTPVGFTVNADNDAKASAARVRSAITGAPPGSIVLAHMNHPGSGTATGISDAITDRRAAGWEFVSLSGHIVS